VIIPFKRGDSKDYPNIKIFSVECKMTENGIKQEM
jgi:hypothetical protein